MKTSMVINRVVITNRVVFGPARIVRILGVINGRVRMLDVNGIGSSDSVCPVLIGVVMVLLLPVLLLAVLLAPVLQ